MTETSTAATLIAPGDAPADAREVRAGGGGLERESTAARCTDGLDNDAEGIVDSAEHAGARFTE